MLARVFVYIWADLCHFPAENCGEEDGKAENVQSSVVPQNIAGSLTSWRAAAPAKASQRWNTGVHFVCGLVV